MSKHPLTAEACLDVFLQSLKDDLLTPATILYYSSTVKIIIRDLRKAGRDPLPYNITADDVRYLLSERWIGLTVKTRKGYRAGLIRFAEHFGNTAPRKVRVRFPHDMRPNVDWLTDEQVRKLLAHPMTPLQRFVVCSELYAGLRRRDLLGLKVSSILPRHLSVLGKGALGGKPRLVPFGPEYVEVITEFLAWRDQLIAKAKKRRPTVTVPDSLLIYEKGGYLYPYDMYGDAIDKQVCRKLSKELGFRFSNHTLRRTLARRLYTLGVKIRTIADILGQEDSAQAEKYIGIINDNMISAIETLSY